MGDDVLRLLVSGPNVSLMDFFASIPYSNVIETRGGGYVLTTFFTAIDGMGNYVELAKRFDLTLEQITWPEGAEKEKIEVIYQGSPIAWSERRNVQTTKPDAPRNGDDESD